MLHPGPADMGNTFETRLRIIISKGSANNNIVGCKALIGSEGSLAAGLVVVSLSWNHRISKRGVWRDLCHVTSPAGNR